jgi:signal peptidase II
VPAAVIVLADQFSKLAIERLTEEGFRRVIIPGFFTFIHTRNTGIAFSMLADSDAPWLRWVLIAFSVVAIVLISWILKTNRAGSRRTQWGLSLVLGGAVGNAVDRILHGSVLDFLDFHAGSYHWPAFNVADSAITMGAMLVIFDLLFAHEQQKKRITDEHR